jgi:membrane-associated phospholipid phosphatase
VATTEAAGPQRAVARSVDVGHGAVRYSVVRLVPAAVLLWAALCGIGYLLTHPLHDTAFERWDGSVNRWLAARRNSVGNLVTHWLTYAAETLTVIVIGAVFFVGIRMYTRRWREPIFLAVALIGEVTIFVSTTMLIDRNRPGVRHLDSAPPTSSFPSGHTAAAVTLYGALAVIALSASTRTWLRRLAVAAAIVVPLCVGFARLYRGMHYPTDVMGGAMLGLVWLAVTWAVILRGHSQSVREVST